MKKKLLAITLAATLIVGCSSSQTDASQEDRFDLLSKQSIDGYRAQVIQDKQTGCQYIITTGGGTSVFSLVQSDGKPICEDL